MPPAIVPGPRSEASYIVTLTTPTDDHEGTSYPQMVCNGRGGTSARGMALNSELPASIESTSPPTPRQTPKSAKTVVVKISAPVPPEAVAGLPFRPVEFDGLTVTPYVDDKRNRVAYSLRARAMRAPATGSAKVAGKPGGGADGKAAA